MALRVLAAFPCSSCASRADSSGGNASLLRYSTYTCRPPGPGAMDRRVPQAPQLLSPCPRSQGLCLYGFNPAGLRGASWECRALPHTSWAPQRLSGALLHQYLESLWFVAPARRRQKWWLVTWSMVSGSQEGPLSPGALSYCLHKPPRLAVAHNSTIKPSLLWGKPTWTLAHIKMPIPRSGVIKILSAFTS